MVAVDANVVVRFLTADDPRQAKRCRAVFQDNEVWISRTVLLETEWVLQGAYELKRREINGALSALCQMEGVQIEGFAQVMAALANHEEGWDFADALHVTQCPADVTVFCSFDRKLVNRKTSSLDLAVP